MREPSAYRASYRPRTHKDKHMAKRRGEDNILPKITNPLLNNADKRNIIKEHNPFHYIFGTALTRIKQEDLLTDVNTDNQGDNDD